MSSSVIVEIPRRRLARITGGLYLAFVLAMALADVFGHIGIGDVELAYQALTTDSSQFAAGLAFGLLSAFLFVMAAWGLYLLLRPVNRDLALLFLLLNAGLWLLFRGINVTADAPGLPETRRRSRHG